MRYRVSRTAAIRPSQFSALNPLDPLYEEEERGENHDRYPDIEKVEHGALQGFLLACATWRATRPGEAGGARTRACRRSSGDGQGRVRPLTDSVKTQESGKSPVQAGPMRRPDGS